MLIDSPRLTPEDRRLWKEAERVDAMNAARIDWPTRTTKALDAMERFVVAGPCYAGISWGKDSTVLAHLIWRLANERGIIVPSVWVVVHPIVNPDCYLVRDAFMAAHPLQRYEDIETHWNGTGTGRLRPGFAIAAERYGCRHISGVRGVESGGRMARMQHWGTNSPNTCAPIGWWKTPDIYAYLYQFQLPVHPAYAMTEGGLWDRNRLRVASLGGQRGQGVGRALWEGRYYREELFRIEEILGGTHEN